MTYPPYWGPWAPPAPPQQPVVFVPTSTGPQPNTAQGYSWQEVAKYAKREAKKEAKLKAKWEEDLRKKMTGVGDKKKGEPSGRLRIPLAEGLFIAVLISPFIGLPTLKLYQAIFQMWGAALGMK